MSASIMEAVQVSPLKGDQILAQGFNPGLDNSRQCALKGHQNPARHMGSKSFARVSSFSRHFQGAFLRVDYPGLKPWAKLPCPFGAQTLSLSRSLRPSWSLEKNIVPNLSLWGCDSIFTL